MNYTFFNMGLNVNPQTVESVFKLADISGDGLIDYEEFYKLFDGILKNTLN